MDAELYNGYWISTDTYLSSAHRDVNAQKVFTNLMRLGWTRESVCGILGNMWVESSLNPALIEGRGVHTLLTNQEALNLIDTTHGVGLVQWTGYTDASYPPIGNKYISFVIRLNNTTGSSYNWYDGDCQCLRLQNEYDEDFQFDHGRVDGVDYDWEIYTQSTDTPEQLAKVFQYLYEKGGVDTQLRQEKARYYYDTLHLNTIWVYTNFIKRRGGTNVRIYV